MNKIPNKLLEIIRNQNFKGIQQINDLLYSSTFYKIQNLLQYHPQLWGIPKSPDNNSIGYRNPGEHQLKYKNIYLETEDHEKLHCWLVLQENSDKRQQKISDQVISKDNQMKNEVPTILYFHGNANNMGFHMNQIKQFHQMGCNVFIVSYRGFGNSTGDPSYQGFQIDSETCINYLLQCNEINSKHIIVYGISLGGAVGIDLTYRKQHQIKALMVENTFTSIADMCDYRFPFLSKVKDLILNNE